jgi:two-component system, cell cycle response regulator DivK
MQEPNLNQLKILIVEDEDRSWYLLRDIVETWNGNAIWAESGMQAIDIVKNDSSIAMVLIDLNLPFMSGIEATKRIKSIRSDLPVVAQTAFAEPDMLNNSLKAGCATYLLKPIDIDKLKQVIIREIEEIEPFRAVH